MYCHQYFFWWFSTSIFYSKFKENNENDMVAHGICFDFYYQPKPRQTGQNDCWAFVDICLAVCSHGGLYRDLNDVVQAGQWCKLIYSEMVTKFQKKVGRYFNFLWPSKNLWTLLLSGCPVKKYVKTISLKVAYQEQFGFTYQIFRIDVSMPNSISFGLVSILENVWNKSSGNVG